MTRSSVIDHAIPIGFIAATLVGTHALVALGLSQLLIPGLVIAPLAIAAAILERVRPERAEYVPFDQPLATDAAHFLINYNLGYAIALGAIHALAGILREHGLHPVWPTAWPTALQVALLVTLAEALSYWQHRAAHRIPFLWRFHALHHSGGRLNLVRAGRFHFVDIAAGTFFSFLPLVLLGAPEAIITWSASISGALGVIEHANMRMRTPAWLDRVICTPAVHRHHHSRLFAENDRNFGTSIMLFDHLFGTYAAPAPDGPEAMGLENDPVPRGFWHQTLKPFTG